MTYENWRSIPEMFFDMAQQCGDRPFLWSKHDGKYHPQNWPAVEDEVLRLSAGLISLGVEPGSRVVLVSENRPKWVIADLAIMSAGAITVPAYTTNTTDLHEHVLRDSGASLAIVSNAKIAKYLLPACAATGVKTVVSMEDVESTNDVTVVGWSDACRKIEPERVKSRVDSLERHNTACLIYTSGTGGLPKGVILSHRALLSNIHSIEKQFRDIFSGVETFLSFLPLSHAYEHTAGFCFPISIGAEVYYAESTETLVANLTEARPTIMTCVPRLYEVMRQRILTGVGRASSFRQRLFHAAVSLGTRRIQGEHLNLIERIQDRILDRLVRNKVRDRFGGRIKALLSGGAPLNVDVGTFFSALGLPVLQGYGQTEAAPVISCNLLGKVRLETVGPPLPDVDVHIAEDGEILVRGDLLMDGYWNLPDVTSETVRDGWLHTGDIGEFDEAGYLKITDRKKDFIVNSGGDNISPQRVEGILNLESGISQSMVVGDKRPHLVALIVPEEEFVTSYARDNNTTPDLANLRNNPGFQEAIDEMIEHANKGLTPVERVKRFIIASEPFSIENEQMTPTMKVRRHVLRELYGDALKALYR